METLDAYLMNVEKLVFPDGLQGVPDWKNFRLQQTRELMPVALLESLDEERLSLIVASPFSWFPAYRLEISEEEMAQIGAQRVEDLYILAIINVENDPFQVTANLLAPLIINPHSGLGMQKVLHHSGYQARHPLSLRTLKVHLPEGLLGIPEYKDFVLQSADELAPVFLLTCQDEPELSFPMIDPLILDEQYAPQLSEEDRAALGSPPDDELQIFALLHIENDPFRATANLKAPLVIHTPSGIGRQALLTHSDYQVAHPLQLDNGGMRGGETAG